MLEVIGFRFLRRGKGDHDVYARGTEREIIAGSMNHELPKGLWEELRKKYGLRE